MQNHLQFWASALFLFVSSLLFAKPLPYPQPADIALARALAEANPRWSPAYVASQVPIGDDYRALIEWMRDDLARYSENFDAYFEAKLSRIRRHEAQRLADLSSHTEHVRRQADLGDSAARKELERLVELHKPHGFVAYYEDARDFLEQFVGPSKKLLRGKPSAFEAAMRNRPGRKELYVDTWGVPFFDTGTQTREQAREGVRKALQVFREVTPHTPISLLRFTELMALFARPEFDDVRRFKLVPFPTAEDLKRFGAERSDAKAFGDKYPQEAMAVINRRIDLGPVSYIFGQRVHIFGLIRHSLTDDTADGRIFTGPADFLEHDFAHAFFNLAPVIPGTPDYWASVHREFMAIRDGIDDPRLKRMARLVYYHFTHESGFRVIAEGGFEGELSTIRELLGTRYHYDFILHDGLYREGFEQPLEAAFRLVGGFFRDRFLASTDSGHACSNELIRSDGSGIERPAPSRSDDDPS